MSCKNFFDQESDYSVVIDGRGFNSRSKLLDLNSFSSAMAMITKKMTEIRTKRNLKT